MIAGQPWRGSTETRCNSAASGVRGHHAAHTRGRRARGGAEPAAAGVLGDVGGRDAIAAGEPLSREVARAVAHVAAVVPEERPAAVVGVVVAVAVLDDAVGLVDAVGVVVAPARPEGEREHGDGDERDVAGAVAPAVRHRASKGRSGCRATGDKGRDSNAHVRRMPRVRVSLTSCAAMAYYVTTPIFYVNAA